MKVPLRYQMTEYDCGPTSLLNAVSYLFPREEIPPEIVRSIMLYCLDCFGADGSSGKCGTSRTAMLFLSSWINGYGQASGLPISSRYLSGESVDLSQNGPVRDALARGGVAVVRVDLEGEHYVLLTRIHGDRVYLFDPYHQTEPCDAPGIEQVEGHPYEYDHIVSAERMERTDQELYAMGPVPGREAILLFNERTMLTAEQTVEYVI